MGLVDQCLLAPVEEPGAPRGYLKLMAKERNRLAVQPRVVHDGPHKPPRLVIKGHYGVACHAVEYAARAESQSSRLMQSDIMRGAEYADKLTARSIVFPYGCNGVWRSEWEFARDKHVATGGYGQIQRTHLVVVNELSRCQRRTRAKGEDGVLACAVWAYAGRKKESPVGSEPKAARKRNDAGRKHPNRVPVQIRGERRERLLRTQTDIVAAIRSNHAATGIQTRSPAAIKNDFAFRIERQDSVIATIQIQKLAVGACAHASGVSNSDVIRERPSTLSIRRERKQRAEAAAISARRAAYE